MVYSKHAFFLLRPIVRERKNEYRPCSDLDVRAAALRATHRRLRAMDSQGIPTINKFGDVLREEKAKHRAFGEYMAGKGTNPIMTWDELEEAVNKFAKKKS